MVWCTLVQIKSRLEWWDKVWKEGIVHGSKARRPPPKLGIQVMSQLTASLPPTNPANVAYLSPSYTYIYIYIYIYIYVHDA